LSQETGLPAGQNKNVPGLTPGTSQKKAISSLAAWQSCPNWKVDPWLCDPAFRRVCQYLMLTKRSISVLWRGPREKYHHQIRKFITFEELDFIAAVKVMEMLAEEVLVVKEV